MTHDVVVVVVVDAEIEEDTMGRKCRRRTKTRKKWRLLAQSLEVRILVLEVGEFPSLVVDVHSPAQLQSPKIEGLSEASPPSLPSLHVLL